jgi:hypothetical protein
VGQIDGFGSVGRAGDLVAFKLEQINQKFKYSLVVIDNQDSASI